MKALLRTTLLFFSFSLVAETTIIERLLDTTESNASQENEDIFVFDDTKNNKESKIEKIINFFDDPENLFVTGTATIGALQILDYINVLAHEYGHALPAIATERL